MQIQGNADVPVASVDCMLVFLNDNYGFQVVLSVWQLYYCHDGIVSVALDNHNKRHKESEKMVIIASKLLPQECSWEKRLRKLLKQVEVDLDEE